MDALRKHSKLAVALCFCLFLSSSVLPSASALAVGSSAPSQAPAQEQEVAAGPTYEAAAAAAGIVLASYQLGKIAGEAAYDFFGPEEELAALDSPDQHKPMDFSKFDG